MGVACLEGRTPTHAMVPARSAPPVGVLVGMGRLWWGLCCGDGDRGPLCCWSPPEAGDAHLPCCGEERVRPCHHVLLASSCQTVPLAPGRVLHQWRRDKEIRVQALGGVAEPPPMVATAGSRGEGAELGREVRADGCNAEADPWAPVGFERCEVRTTSAAPVAAPWYPVHCRVLQFRDAGCPQSGMGSWGSDGSPLSLPWWGCLCPLLSLWVSAALSDLSCQQRQNLKIVPMVLKKQHTHPPRFAFPLPLSHPPKPSAHEVSGTAHFC